jgi:two-component system response regulator HydG
MVVLSAGPKLTVADLPPDMRPPGAGGAGGPHGGGPGPGGLDNVGGIRLEQLEKEAIIKTLAMVHGNREQAAKLLGIGERTLYRKIREYGL